MVHSVPWHEAVRGMCEEDTDSEAAILHRTSCPCILSGQYQCVHLHPSQPEMPSADSSGDCSVWSWEASLWELAAAWPQAEVHNAIPSKSPHARCSNCADVKSQVLWLASRHVGEVWGQIAADLVESPLMCEWSKWGVTSVLTLSPAPLWQGEKAWTVGHIPLQKISLSPNSHLKKKSKVPVVFAWFFYIIK